MRDAAEIILCETSPEENGADSVLKGILLVGVYVDEAKHRKPKCEADRTLTLYSLLENCVRRKTIGLGVRRIPSARVMVSLHQYYSEMSFVSTLT
jgi:hypothetical protein